MTFLIKETELQIPAQDIYEASSNAVFFPTEQHVLFDNEQLLPIALLDIKLLNSNQNYGNVSDAVLIAVPNVQGTFYGDEPFISYSLTAQGWVLDAEYHDAATHILEEDYLEHYKKAQAYFKKHEFLTYNLSAGDKSVLFELGGQPPLGQNWDAIMYDEMADNPELDHYHEVMDEESGAEYEKMCTREIVYFDDSLQEEFIYLGKFSYDIYLGSSGEGIVFYQPKLKKVMIVTEFS